MKIIKYKHLLLLCGWDNIKAEEMKQRVEKPARIHLEIVYLYVSAMLSVGDKIKIQKTKEFSQ